LTLSISISQIKYVLALHKAGNFSEAAEACFVTQSTLSTMIKKLENQLELKLFDRTLKPISLTREGEALLKQFQITYHEYENLNDLINETKEGYYGTLKIGIIPTVAPFLLPLFLDRILNSYPNVKFELFEITTHDIIQRIKSRELDIGILSIPLSDTYLKQKSLFKEDFLVYDTRSPGVKNKRYRIKDIEVNRLWLLEESHCLTNQIEKICQLRKVNDRNQNLKFTSGSILSLIELVNMNKGLTLLPKMATLNKKLIDAKCISPIENPVPLREIGVVMHPNFSKNKLLSVLEKEILKAVKPILNNSRKANIIKPF